MSCLTIGPHYFHKLRIDTVNFDGMKAGESCVFDEKKFLQRNSPYDDLLNVVTSDFSSVRVLKPKEVFCEDSWC